MKNKKITPEILINHFKENVESIEIELDNLDYARLVFNSEGEVVVRTEHGTEFPVGDLSQIELEIFYENI